MRALIGLLVVALGLATCFVSDLFIRSQDIPGTNPGSYDAIGSFLIGMGGVMLLVGFWTRS